MYTCLFILLCVYWISCCPHADQILPKLSASYRRLSRLSLMHHLTLRTSKLFYFILFYFCAEQSLTTITASLFPRNFFRVGYLLHLARWLGEILAEKYRKVEICLNPKPGTRLKWVLKISRQISLPTQKEPPRYELCGPKSRAKLWEEDYIPRQGCTNPERQVARAIKFHTVGREYVTWFILRRLLDLWEVCVPMFRTVSNNISFSAVYSKVKDLGPRRNL